ncbi:hypothetical protein Tsubulata_028457 [Turnera subulata]|uniref:Plastid lipid-associated protein/fibrillin conserved domain-containing protein n=1 Tax=Turnera subulata TaxID=218843 RepID=A0A9Q0F3D3_9ROSI|nr:hypothetical protein Tsubulata_028457 [Turnera subulata]
MALSSPNTTATFTAASLVSRNSAFPKPTTLNFSNDKPTSHSNFCKLSSSPSNFYRWRAKVSFFPAFLNKGKDAKVLKEELLEAIEPLDRGADATPEDQQRVDQIARKLEAVSPIKAPLKSDLLNGKWELIYTTSQLFLQTQRPKFLRSRTNYQAINVDTRPGHGILAILQPGNSGFDTSELEKDADISAMWFCLDTPTLAFSSHASSRQPRGLYHLAEVEELASIPVKAPGRPPGELEITYLDEELRQAVLPDIQLIKSKKPTNKYLTIPLSQSIFFLSSNYQTQKEYSCFKSNRFKLYNNVPDTGKWRVSDSFFQAFVKKDEGIEALKEELFEMIAPLDRGAEATPQDQERVDKIARKLEAVNKIKEPLKSNLLNGKWELMYTTSQSVLQTKRPKILRPNGKIYQAINVDTLRAQNLETWPFYNQVTANLVPLNARRVAVKFDFFRIAGLIPIASPGSGRGQLEITYLDEDLRISRGNEGNLFILKMVDPFYRVPT